MVTKTKGGVITSYTIGLTLEAQSDDVLPGVPVMITGDYECDIADGSAPVIGVTAVVPKVVPATGGDREVPTPPYEVSVHAFCVAVLELWSAENTALSAGAKVGIDADGNVAAVGAGVQYIGIALTSVTATAATRKQLDVAIGVPV